ncbi:hypothetical protein ABPG74_013662 [Tetrahymena malaccensis]
MEKHGYQMIVQNILEHKQVFSRTLGDTSEIINKEMYGFTDQSGKELVLRPEGTASVVRHILENSKHFEQQQKYYYYGPMYRYERPQLGRQRQFYQLGCEFLHKENPKNSYLIDAEIIIVAHKFLQRVLGKNSEFQMEINTIGDVEDRVKYNSILKEYYEKNIHKLSELSKMRLERNNPLRIFDSKEAQDQDLIANAPQFSESMKQESKEYFRNLLEVLDSLNISYKINPLLVRGLDYYSHTCFEIKNVAQQGKSQDTILAGGRYDHLASVLNSKTTNLNGVGFACGIERIGLLLQDDDPKLKEFEKKKIKIGIVPVLGKQNISDEFERNLKLYCVNLMNSIADEQIEVQLVLHTSKMDKQMEYLLKNDFKWGIFIGESEVKEKKVSIKNLLDRESFTIEREKQVYQQEGFTYDLKYQLMRLVINNQLDTSPQYQGKQLILLFISLFSKNFILYETLIRDKIIAI